MRRRLVPLLFVFVLLGVSSGSYALITSKEKSLRTAREEIDSLTVARNSAENAAAEEEQRADYAEEDLGQVRDQLAATERQLDELQRAGLPASCDRLFQRVRGFESQLLDVVTAMKDLSQTQNDVTQLAISGAYDAVILGSRDVAARIRDAFGEAASLRTEIQHAELDAIQCSAS